ncbi:MAG: hypothetical protein SFY56_02850 [Bacteroidota bacterium]|nr:hypothetical protein [Bacteroidota bacterium]
MKHLIILFISYFLCQVLCAQESMYGYVKLGKYRVGIADTVIFDSRYDYKQFEYNGKKPYFIKIWHPIQKKQKGNYLNIKDLFVLKQNESLKGGQDSLELIYKKHFIRDYLFENLENGNENNYGKYSFENVFDLVGKIDTRSIRASITRKSNLPVVIYYNGSQGHPFENFILAEYFASRGYIFVAASFELQFGNSPFGMLPYDRYHSNEYEESLKTISKFAQSLTNSSNIFFVGHSMGAQMGLRTFGQDSAIKGLVSLETSIEFKSDYDKIKEMWPEVYKKIITDKVNYPFPILFCAATGENKPFNFLENVKAPQITYVSTLKEFEHNAYLSLFYLKYFLNNSVEQTDKHIIKKRLPLYVKHLETIYSFINKITEIKNVSKLESILISE